MLTEFSWQRDRNSVDGIYKANNHLSFACWARNENVLQSRQWLCIWSASQANAFIFLNEDGYFVFPLAVNYIIIYISLCHKHSGKIQSILIILSSCCFWLWVTDRHLRREENIVTFSKCSESELFRIFFYNWFYILCEPWSMNHEKPWNERSGPMAGCSHL